jgi:formylglycine-generating enzyme
MIGKALVRGLLGTSLLLCCAVVARAVTIDLVPVGDVGNAADTRTDTTFVMPPDGRMQGDVGTQGAGAVSHFFAIGKYEVTAGQYADFLDAVAATDPYGLYNASMWTSEYGCKIQQNGASGSYTYSIAPEHARLPVNYVSWGDAARFSNWLQNGQPTGAEDNGTTETGTYTLNGAVTDSALMAVARNAGATYFLPTRDEWYKAAYYKGGGQNAGYWTFSTQSNATPGRDDANYLGYYDMGPGPFPTSRGLMPVGSFSSSVSAFGTFDQGGNVGELLETGYGASYRRIRGGDFDEFWCYGQDPAYGIGDNSLAANFGDHLSPTWENSTTGFRMAGVPEPGSIAMMIGVAVSLLIYARHRRHVC